MTVHLLRRAVAAAVAATLLPATPALAHPFFDPDEVPVDSLATVVLDLSHGCGVDDHEEDEEDVGEEGSPTREVAIEVPEAATFVDPREPDGWDLAVEGGRGEREVLVYSAEDGTDEPAPRFEFDVVLAGDDGDEVDWRVVQACDDATHRWVGTPDEPAEDPAIRVTLAEADGNAPPPDEAGEPGTVTVTGDDEEEPAVTEEPAAPEEPAEAPDDEVPATDGSDLEAAEEAAMPGWILIVVLVATLAVAGVVLSLKSRDEAQDGTSGGSDTPAGGGAGAR